MILYRHYIMTTSGKYCHSSDHDQRKKLSIVEREIGKCKWCAFYFCQAHNKIEQHDCQSFDKQVAREQVVQSKKNMVSKDYYGGDNCAF